MLVIPVADNVTLGIFTVLNGCAGGQRGRGRGGYDRGMFIFEASLKNFSLFGVNDALFVTCHSRCLGDDGAHRGSYGHGDRGVLAVILVLLSH